MTPPQPLKAIAFIDGQNLYHAVKDAFGYTYPNFDIKKLAKAICINQGWTLIETRFYTGVPRIGDNKFWHGFWSAKLGAMKKQKRMVVYHRFLRYLKKEIVNAGGKKQLVDVADEKGIDVRIAIDTIRLASKGRYDVALLFSQDQDLSEVADEIREIAKEESRYIKIASAFPHNPASRHKNRGIDKTDWIPFDKNMYDGCLDSRDYRPKTL